MSRSLSLRLAAAVAGALLLVGIADARPVTFFFGGTFTSVDGGLAGRFAVGQRFVGYYTVESSTPDQSALETLGRYPAVTAAGVLVLADDPRARYVAHATGGQIDVFNQPTLDAYAMYALAGVEGRPVGDAALERFQFQLNDPTAQGFTSDALPLRLRLRRFESRTFVMEFAGEQLVLGELTSLVRGLPPV